MLLTVAILVLFTLVALSLASYSRHRIATTFFVLSFMVAAVFDTATHELFTVVAAWALTIVLGLVLQTVKDTVAELIPEPDPDDRDRRRAARERARLREARARES
jgi:hypothetical protein